MALLVMQSVGGFHAYLCDCAGEVTWTKVDHCHGPHSEDCHAHESGIPHQHDEGSGDRHDHETVIRELQVRSVEALHVPVVVPVLLSWMPEWIEHQGSSCGYTARSPQIEPDTGPPPSVTVARAVVFLI